MWRPNKKVKRHCWCGNKDLSGFSPEYLLCNQCGTLVSQVGLADSGCLVQDDEVDFYGKNYWFDHQARELGYPDIQDRARLDMAERCIYWLRQILTFHLPPAAVLELGASHGGFVALMRSAGFNATGLELSPWVADFARTAFDAPMLVGPIEQQKLPAESYDVIVANDVFEHLPEPVTTLNAAASLLKPEGLLILQMPDFVEGENYAARVARRERFLEHMGKADEHLYLYSKRSARALLSRFGLNYVQFCRPIFDYDMYLVASRQPLRQFSPQQIAKALQETPSGRLVLALLDKSLECDRVSRSCHEADADRRGRLQAMTRLGEQLSESETDRAARLEVILELTRGLTASQEERKACLQTLKLQEKVIKDCQATIRAAHQALNLGTYPRLGRRLWERCEVLPKLLAKSLVPGVIRRQLRKLPRLRGKIKPRSETTTSSCAGPVS